MTLLTATKRCPRCERSLSVDSFHRNRSNKDGLQTYCHECSNNMRREYEARNAEALALRRAERLARQVDPDQTKVCRKCGERKALLQFYAHRGTKDRRANYCAECQKQARREWSRKNADRVREHNARRSKVEKRRDHRQWWLRLYNLTPEDYAALLDEQGGVCAICRRAESYIDARTGEPRRLAVDHDHATGHVRGLLCGRCNRCIGQFKDDPELLLSAALYLEGNAAGGED